MHDHDHDSIDHLDFEADTSNLKPSDLIGPCKDGADCPMEDVVTLLNASSEIAVGLKDLALIEKQAVTLLVSIVGRHHHPGFSDELWTKYQTVFAAQAELILAIRAWGLAEADKLDG